jgi:putative phosphoesterase
MVIGIISDTHGLMRPEALKALAGSSLIIHAGDVGGLKVREELRGIVLVFAVRGNVDTQSWAAALPAARVISVGAHRFYVLHDISELAIDPLRKGVAAVVFGHSHKPSIEWRGDILYLNPGSAGPRRFRLPVCVASVEVAGKRIRPHIIRLDLP